MFKRVIALIECKDGDIIADEVINKYGTAIVVKDTIINEYLKQKLQDMGVKNISIYQMNTADQDYYDIKHKNLITDYYKNLKTIKQIIRDLAAGKGLDYIKIKNISDTFYKQINDDANIALNLSRLRHYDESTYSHCLNVSIYAGLFGKWLGLTKDEIKNLIQAGILHDIGKTKIIKDILNKKGKLLPHEYEIVKKHPLLGYKMVKKNDAIPDEVKIAILMHHERANGSGYPFGYGLDHLNLFSKAIAIVDVYDAIISDRVYKNRSTPFEAFEWLLGPGLALFDIPLVDMFCKNISCSYIGAGVLLDNGATGEVVYIPPHNISRPIIKIQLSYVDLSKQTNTRIMKMK